MNPVAGSRLARPEHGCNRATPLRLIFSVKSPGLLRVQSQGFGRVRCTAATAQRVTLNVKYRVPGLDVETFNVGSTVAVGSGLNFEFRLEAGGPLR